MKLVILDGPLKNKEFPVNRSSIIIGRKSQADIPLTYDLRLSRFHCQVLCIEGQCFLEDLDSGNGTWLDGTRITQRTPLSLHSIFQVGQTRLCLLPDQALAPENVGTPSPPLLNSNQKYLSVQSAISEEDPSGCELNITQSLDPREITQMEPDTATDIVENPSELAVARRFMNRLAVFQRISEALVGQLSTQQFLETVVDNIIKVVPAERIFLFLLEGEKQKLVLAVYRSRQRCSHPIISRTIVNRVLRERMALIIQDTRRDDELSVSESIKKASIRSVMCVPLLYKEYLRAIICLDTTQSHSFTQEHLELVTAVANQAALALENVRLFEKLQQAYHELQQAQDQLIQSEKLSVIGTLAASIAHDIGNLITPIVGISDLMMENHDVDPELQEIFERRMNWLRALTHQLLSFSRPQPLEILTVDVNKLLRESLMLVQTEARHNAVEICLELAPHLPPIPADPQRLLQVFVNLTLNAFQAMIPQGGGRLSIKSFCQGENVILSFTDTGPGIATEDLAHIFEAFFTTKGKEGTGLGLFSCKRIIEEEHQGRIWVDSIPGQGASFNVSLPQKPSGAYYASDQKT